MILIVNSYFNALHPVLKIRLMLYGVVILIKHTANKLGQLRNIAFLEVVSLPVLDQLRLE